MKIENEFYEYVDIELSNILLDNLTKTKNYKWLPYIGVNYKLTEDKILLIGKSHYEWENTDDCRKQLRDIYFNLEAIIWNGLGLDRWKKIAISEFKNKKFYRGLERVFFNTKNIYNDTINSIRPKLWKSIAFHQLIQTPMNDGWQHKDTKKERIRGFENVLEIVNIINPKNIIMMSNSYNYDNAFVEVFTKNGYIKSNDIIYSKSSNSEIRSICVNKGNYSLNFTLIVHPSSSKSNFTEQNELLKRAIPSYLESISS